MTPAELAAERRRPSVEATVGPAVAWEVRRLTREHGLVELAEARRIEAGVLRLLLEYDALRRRRLGGTGG